MSAPYTPPMSMGPTNNATVKFDTCIAGLENQDTWQYSWDQYGNQKTLTTPRNVTTTNTWSYTNFALGLTPKKIREGSLAGSDQEGRESSRGREPERGGQNYSYGHPDTTGPSHSGNGFWGERR